MKWSAPAKSTSLLCLMSLGLVANAGAQEIRPENKAKRPVTVRDSIMMNMLADDHYYSGYSLIGPVAEFSPDGSKFVIVLRTGDLEHNTNRYSLLLWQTDTVFQSPGPEALLEMASSSNRAAIEQMHWLDDNETLAFLGEHPGEYHQLYTLNIRTHTLRQLTDHPANLLSYAITTSGTRFAYTAERPVESIFDNEVSHKGYTVSTGARLPELVLGRTGWEITRPQLFVQSTGDRPRLLKLSSGVPVPSWAFPPHLSPDGKYVAIAAKVPEVPAIWREYSQQELHEFARAKAAPGGYSWLTRYLVVNTETGEEKILLDSPLDTNLISHAAWLPDSCSLAISGVYLPLDNSKGEERKIRQSTVFSVEVKIPSGEFIEVSREDLALLGWDSKANRLVFEVGNSMVKPQGARRVYFRRNNAAWEKDNDTPAEEKRASIVLEEDINSPPRIFAVMPVTGEKKLLLDLNPEFNQLAFGMVEEIQWQGSDGHYVKGGLYYPVGYVPGKRYPLVIQTHGWNAHRFWIDGAITTGYAAQALAGKGIMVLQVDENYAGMYTFAGVEREVAGLQAAIRYLAARSLVDRNRIGIIGFSITGIYVKYALSHWQYHFTAASVADDVDAGYFQYIAFADGDETSARIFEALNGGVPFGNGLKSWMQRTPAFNVARVQTPLRIMALNPASLINEWEWFAAMRRLAKPVEMVYIQDGAHVLEKPWERMISQQGNVDWFCFWLKREEDKDPAKAEQYARWRELRRLQEENSKATSRGPEWP